MADHWFQSTGRFGLLKVIAPSFFDGFSRERWQTLIEHLKSNVMEKVSENLLPFSRNLQANGAQFFWDTLYFGKNYCQSQVVLLFENCSPTKENGRNTAKVSLLTILYWRQQKNHCCGLVQVSLSFISRLR